MVSDCFRVADPQTNFTKSESQRGVVCLLWRLHHDNAQAVFSLHRGAVVVQLVVLPLCVCGSMAVAALHVYAGLAEYDTNLCSTSLYSKDIIILKLSKTVADARCLQQAWHWETSWCTSTWQQRPNSCRVCVVLEPKRNV